MKGLFFEKFAAPLVVCLIILLFFLPKLILGKVPIPADSLLGLYHPFRDISFEGYSPGRFPVKNPLATDPILQTYPYRLLAIKNFKEANWPLWNPYTFSGQPFLANVQAAPFEIFNLLFFILPFKIAWAASIILPPTLLGLFTFFLLKDFKIATGAAVFGGFILPFTGFFTAWQTWGTVTTAALWLPLILWSIRRLFVKTSAKWFLILTFALAQTVFAGHAQTALYVYGVSLLFLISSLLSNKSIKAFLIILSSFSLSILICSPSILPAIELVRLSLREIDQGYFFGRTDWFIPPQNLLQLLAPDFFGNPTTYNYWGVWNWAEFVSFIGAVPLFMALGALFNFQRASREIRFFVFLAGLSLLLALASPISKIPYVFNFPFIASMQPSRIIFLLDFSLAILAAFGLEIFLKEKVPRFFLLSLALLATVLLILLALTKTQSSLFPQVKGLDPTRIAFRNLIPPTVMILILSVLMIIKAKFNRQKLLILVIFALTFIELFRFYHKFTPFSKINWIFPQTQITKYLSSRQKPFRVMTTDRRILNTNIPAVYGIETVAGYDPLYLESYAKLVSSWESGNLDKPGSFNRIITPQKYNSPIANLLNVEYILTFDEISDPGFEKVFQEGQTKVFKNNNALPRAFFVNEVVGVAKEDQELEKLLSKNYNLATSAVSSTFEFPKQNFSASVAFKQYSDQSFKIATTSDKKAPLILSNVFYPGWKAFVDGREAEVKRANFMFQAVVVPEGEHEVELKFRPKVFYNGLYLSAAGITLTLLISILLWRKKFQ